MAGAALLFATGRTALALAALAGAGAVLAPRLGTRYDRGGAPDDPWAALDRGEDPTDTIPR